MSGRPRFTSGQYSLLRALIGASLFAWAALRTAQAVGGSGAPGPEVAAVDVALLVLLGTFALLLAAGWHDRLAAALALTCWAVLAFRAPSPAIPALLAFGWLLLAHLFVPPAPYGSVAARGRPDPAGGWSLPAPIWIGTWVVLVADVVLLARQWNSLGGLAWIAGIKLLALFAFDPGWIKGRGGTIPETLFYDGICGLCHHSVRFVLAEDPEGRRFRFATLQGRRYRSAIDESRRRDLPDSLVLLEEGGRVLTRSQAVRHALLRLGGYWTVLGWIGGLVPRPLGDAAYDLVARVRHRLFARPPDACPVTPRHLRARFDLD
jgi:predicted DCC family thiol-disulfide oxidoreductase YuxK